MIRLVSETAARQGHTRTRLHCTALVIRWLPREDGGFNGTYRGDGVHCCCCIGRTRRLCTVSIRTLCADARLQHDYLCLHAVSDRCRQGGQRGVHDVISRVDVLCLSVRSSLHCVREMYTHTHTHTTMPPCTYTHVCPHVSITPHICHAQTNGVSSMTPH